MVHEINVLQVSNGKVGADGKDAKESHLDVVLISLEMNNKDYNIVKKTH